jgi:hypothetical protein
MIDINDELHARRSDRVAFIYFGVNPVHGQEFPS